MIYTHKSAIFRYGKLNIRAAGKDDNVMLTPPMKMTLERALSYIGDDEWNRQLRGIQRTARPIVPCPLNLRLPTLLSAGRNFKASR